MLPNESETASHFQQVGLSLEPYTVGKGSRSTTRWQLHAGHRLYRLGCQDSFVDLPTLWRAWHAEQPLLERNYQCAVDIARDAPDWSREQQASMGEWLHDHMSERRRSPHRRQGWPWNIMRSEGRWAPLVTNGAPWTNRPVPAAIDPASAADAVPGDSAWLARALVVGRFSTQFSLMFAGSLSRLLSDPERVILDERIGEAGRLAAARKRL